MDDITKDERFKHIPTDKRFKEMHRKERKFKVDKRFNKMFHDGSFKLKYSVDKRGRPVNLTTNDNLKKFYELSSESENEEKDKKEKENNERSVESLKKGEEKETTESEEQSDEDDEEVGTAKAKAADQSESSSDSSSSDDDDDDDYSSDESGISADAEIPWNEFDKDTERTEDISRRLAVCNMDWDRIKASDIYVLLNSFKPINGVIKSVKIYLSDYGAERVAYESLNGPKELTENASAQEQPAPDSHDEDDDGEDRFDRLKLRAYQFNRLKYYYGVIECDTAETANKIYTECDGMEYESSCTRLDLRFIPDDEEFEREPKDACVELPDPLTFKPNLFFTTALNQTKVECTWDETPRDRLAITMKKYTEEDLMKSNDFKKLLASSESEEDDGEEGGGEEDGEKAENGGEEEESGSDEDGDAEEKRMRKYRSLLLGIEEKDREKTDKKMGLAFSWGDDDDKDFGADRSDTDSDDNLVSDKKKEDKKGSKKMSKGKKKALTEEEKAEEAKLSMLAMDNDERPHFNLDDLLLENSKSKKSKKKRRMVEEKLASKAQDDFEMNVADPRFNAIFENHKFNIDPSDQQFKKTKAMEVLMEAKNKRKIAEADQVANGSAAADFDEAKKTKRDPTASLLISSIKSRAETEKQRKKEIKDRQSKIRFSMNKR